MRWLIAEMEYYSGEDRRCHLTDVYSGRVRHTARNFETPFPEFEVIPSGTF